MQNVCNHILLFQSLFLVQIKRDEFFFLFFFVFYWRVFAISYSIYTNI